MDQVAKLFEKKFNLGLTLKQMDQIDTIFQELMREHYFPTQLKKNESLLKYTYYKKALKVLSEDQFKKLKYKKVEQKLRAKEKAVERNKKHKAFISEKYYDLKFTEDQLDIVSNISKKRKSHTHTKDEILSALKGELTENQIMLLNQIFDAHQEEINKWKDGKEARNILSAKSEYNFLSLTDEQALNIYKLQDSSDPALQKETRSYNEYPYKANPILKSILTADQFATYEVHQNERKNKELEEFIEEDKKKQGEFIDQEEWKNFIIEHVLNKKCVILKELLATASDNDLKKIEQLKTQYTDKINKSLLDGIAKHKERYLDKLPNSLKLKILNASMAVLIPNAQFFRDELNLNENIFDTLELNDKQIQSVKAIKLKVRDFYIEKFESKIGSYMGLIITSMQLKVEPYEELYSLILLEPDLEKNLKKMELFKERHYKNISP